MTIIKWFHYNCFCCVIFNKFIIEILWKNNLSHTIRAGYFCNNAHYKIIQIIFIFLIIIVSMIQVWFNDKYHNWLLVRYRQILLKGLKDLSKGKKLEKTWINWKKLEETWGNLRKCLVTWGNLGKLGKIWENLGKLGETWGTWGNFRKLE